MTKHAHLAIDLGAESGRAIIGVLDDDRLTLHELHRFVNEPDRLPTGLHWNLDRLWADVLEGASRAVAFAREQNAPLVSLGVDTWGVDYGLIDEAGDLLLAPYCYRDERHRAAFEKTISAIGEKRLYEATGIQFMALNTLFQLAAQRDADAALLARADRLLFMPDLMHHRFTGESVVEASIASTSQMVDPRTGTWAVEIVEAAGLPTHLLGPISPAGTRIGPLLPDVAARLGADEQLQVIAPAAHDTASAVAAVPADAETKWCFLSSGTWSLLGAELDGPCMTDAAREAPFTNEIGLEGKITFLKNITGLWLVQECRRHFESAGASYSYEELTDLAAAAEPFRTLIDPDHPPFSAPGDLPGKIARYARATAQPEPENVGQFVRCCLESLALMYRITLEQLERVLGRTFDVMHVVGGGARNELLNQMTADATGRTVVVGPHEATAIGNILVQAMGAGLVDDPTDLRRIVAANVKPASCGPRDSAIWTAALSRFRELLHVPVPDDAGAET